MYESYGLVVWKQFKKNRIGCAALLVLSIFFIMGLYAPFFASSKPLLIIWNGNIYFPLLRYLFYSGFYTKPIDLFFNLLMFTLPIAILGNYFFKKWRKGLWISIFCAHFCLFGWILSGVVKNPTNDVSMQAARKSAQEDRLKYYEDPLLAPFSLKTNWSLELTYLPLYAKINQILEYKNLKSQHQRLKKIRAYYFEKTDKKMPTLWHVWQRNESTRKEELQSLLNEIESKYQNARDQLPKLKEVYRPFSHAFIMAKYVIKEAKNDDEKKQAENHLSDVINEAASHRAALSNARHIILTYQKAQEEIHYLSDKKDWMEKESKNMRIIVPSFFRTFHWEEDAGGAQEANQYLPWWELTRINRKDLVSSLLFGIRISIVVGSLAILLALIIGIPLGTIAGYFVGKTDLFICRVIEIWEAMPAFFMLLLIVAIVQSKSIFIVIASIGVFGWTNFARFIRSEVLKQRKLPYVDACRSLGFNHKHIMFSHILPNAIPPILTLLPFAMMAAITSEAGLSFLGLGEEGSTSWGVLMDEGRSVFPAESYLLWPPAILLTFLLISIALIGDALRDAIDPKMRQ